jgi:hypothetical protein
VIGAIRRTLRRRIPEPIRLQVALARRRLGDQAFGTARLIVRRSKLEAIRTDETHRCLVQIVRTSPAGAREVVGSDIYLLPARR